MSHEQHANELNSAQDDVDEGHANRECEIETEKYSEVLQLSSGPSQDPAECSENSKNSKDSNAGLTASNANVLKQKNGHVESITIDGKCTLRKRAKERQFLTK